MTYRWNLNSTALLRAFHDHEEVANLSEKDKRAFEIITRHEINLTNIDEANVS